MTFKQANLISAAIRVIAFGAAPTEWKLWGWWTLLIWPATVLVGSILVHILIHLMMDFWSDELEEKEDEVSSEWSGAARMAAAIASFAFQTPVGHWFWDEFGWWSLIFVAFGIFVGTLPSTASSSSSQEETGSKSNWFPVAVGTYLILRGQREERRRREQKEALEKIHRIWHPND